MARNMDYREQNRKLQNEINYRIIGSHMREVRKQCGFTQKTLAEYMGVDTNYYGSLETGANRISFSRFIQFMAMTNASADYLLMGCHQGLGSNHERISCACKERQLLERILDSCPNETIKIIYALCKALNEELK